MKKIAIIATAIIGFSLTSNAQLASSTATQQVALALTNAIDITFTGSGTATGAAVSLPFATVNDYANGVASTAQALKVRSNLGFIITANANAANFTYTGSATSGNTMPVSGVLGLQVTANGTGGATAAGFSAAYGSLTATAQNIITGGVNGNNQTFSVQYKATPGFAYSGGTYTTNVIYTATQQ